MLELILIAQSQMFTPNQVQQVKQLCENQTSIVCTPQKVSEILGVPVYDKSNDEILFIWLYPNTNNGCRVMFDYKTKKGSVKCKENLIVR